ncbi:MAG: EF-hand domain-containing protein [Hyphomonadaceae bacterium]|nr:EF-hand domain-containing protein [Hyphomonadaceae bacterium]
MRVDGALVASVSRKLFDAVDRNRDGAATFDEMRGSGVLRKLGVARTEAEEKSAFKSADVNGDDRLSSAESNAYFTGVLANSPQALAAAIMIVMQTEAKERSLEELSAKVEVEKTPPKEADDDDEARLADRKAESNPMLVGEAAEAALRELAHEFASDAEATRQALDVRQAAAYAETQARTQAALTSAATSLTA